MPKRARISSQSKTQQQLDSIDDVEIDDVGHTPKWTRSSASASPGPFSSIPARESLEHDDKLENQHIQCTLPGHSPVTLLSSTEFDLHYAKEHNNQCLECRANLPSAWLLELHQTENHDPLVAAQRDKGAKTYRCFLNDCEKVTLTPQKRRLHLIDKHGFRKDYDFRIVDSGSRDKSSLLRDFQPVDRRRRISDVGVPGWRDRVAPLSNQCSIQEVSDETIQKRNAGDTESSKDRSYYTTEGSSTLGTDPAGPAQDDSVASLSTAMSALSFVPLSVRMRSKKKI